MIKHVVMWKLKEEAEGSTRKQNALKIKQKLEALKDIIPQIQSMEIGINFLESDMAYDAVLISTFRSQADLDTYKNHPDHQAVSAFVKKVRTGRTVVDFQM